jgi:hypothetical protein
MNASDLASAQTLLTTLYSAFNARDISTLLASMTPDVSWPNGWEGGVLHGRDAVGDYWRRQWDQLQPTVVPTAHAQGFDRVDVDETQLDSGMGAGQGGGCLRDDGAQDGLEPGHPDSPGAQPDLRGQFGRGGVDAADDLGGAGGQQLSFGALPTPGPGPAWRS